MFMPVASFERDRERDGIFKALFLAPYTQTLIHADKEKMQRNIRPSKDMKGLSILLVHVERYTCANSHRIAAGRHNGFKGAFPLTAFTIPSPLPVGLEYDTEDCKIFTFCLRT